MRTTLQFGLVALWALNMAGSAWAQARSASYGQLTLAVDGTTVTGVFSDARVGNGTDDAPQFTCVFPLRATFANGPMAVTVWDSDAHGQERISGTLTVTGDMARLRLQQNPPGCDMTGEDFVKIGFEEASDRDGTWTSVRLVSADRAPFHAAPLESSTRRGYVVQWDPVVIYRRIGTWLDAEYYGGRHPVRGWLRDGDLAPDHP